MAFRVASVPKSHSTQVAGPRPTYAQTSGLVTKLVNVSKPAITAAQNGDFNGVLQKIPDYWAATEVGGVLKQIGVSGDKAPAAIKVAAAAGRRSAEAYLPFLNERAAFENTTGKPVAVAEYSDTHYVAKTEAQQASATILTSLGLSDTAPYVNKLNELDAAAQRDHFTQLISKLESGAPLTNEESAALVAAAVARVTWASSQGPRDAIGHLQPLAASEKGRTDPAVRGAYNLFPDLLKAFKEPGRDAAAELAKDFSQFGFKPKPEFYTVAW